MSSHTNGAGSSIASSSSASSSDSPAMPTDVFASWQCAQPQLHGGRASSAMSGSASGATSSALDDSRPSDVLNAITARASEASREYKAASSTHVGGDAISSSATHSASSGTGIHSGSPSRVAVERDEGLDTIGTVGVV